MGVSKDEAAKLLGVKVNDAAEVVKKAYRKGS